MFTLGAYENVVLETVKNECWS